jgi:imidazolonepropionase-like amidohydrolase
MRLQLRFARVISFIWLWLCSNTIVEAQIFLFKNCTVHTVSGETFPNGKILIADGKIHNVAGEKGRINVPKNTKNIDLKGLHVYPGMIALNSALGLTEISAVRATRDINETGEYTPDVQSWIAVSPDSELLPVARANGVTHFQPAPQGGVVAGQSGLVALDGWTMEQMVVKKPAALHIYWPDMDLDTTPKEDVKDQSKFKSLDDQAKERQKKLRELDEFFADARAYAKAAEAKAGGADFEKVPDWEAMLPYLRGEVPVMIHADAVRQIKAAVTWATTNQLKMILAGGRDAFMVPDLLVTNKIPVLYEHIFTQPARDTEPYDVHFKAQEALRNAGVRVATGMGATTFDAGLMKNLPYQAAQAVAFGLPRDEALRSLTLYPAEFVGVSDRLGSIEPGKDATFFAADGDIFDIRTQVQRMWIAGKEASLQDRHKRFYEKYKGRPKAQASGQTP